MMKFLVLGLFATLTAVEPARADSPASKVLPQGDQQMELLGPRQDRFTKSFKTRECGKAYCWTPVQVQKPLHFQIMEQK